MCNILLRFTQLSFITVLGLPGLRVFLGIMGKFYRALPNCHKVKKFFNSSQTMHYSLQGKGISSKVKSFRKPRWNLGLV